MIETSGHDHARGWLTDLTRDSSVVDAAAMRSALLAVLDLHKPFLAKGDPVFCDICYHETWWPCSTVRAINAALGVDDE